MNKFLKIVLGVFVVLFAVNTIWVITDMRKDIADNNTLIIKHQQALSGLISICKAQQGNIVKLTEICVNLDTIDRELIKAVAVMPDAIKNTKLLLEAKLKQVNVVVYNKTRSAVGSGVTLKYKGKFYILSAGHMADAETDNIWLVENDTKICELEIVKHDYDSKALLKENSHDLLLLRPKNPDFEPKVYAELADVEPEVSNEVYIVGNPMNIEDVVSDGRVIMYEGNFMYLIGISYFGNSGGGIYTRDGKVVGIMSHLAPIQPFPDKIVKTEDPTQPYIHVSGIPPYMISGAVSLKEIKKFLENVE